MKAGKTMKQAAKSWGKGSNKEKSPRKSSPKKNQRRKKTMAKKITRKRSGFKLPGGIGPKGVLTGVLGLMVIPRFVPVQSRGAQKLATGLALRALKLGGGGPLSAVGLMELAAEYAGPLLGGFTGSAGNGTISAVYDY